MQLVVNVMNREIEPTPLVDLAVIFPVYNEGIRVREAIEAAIDAGVGLVVAVNDCSTDSTGDILRSCASLRKVEVLHHDRNLGKQAAVKHGLKRALRYDEIEKFATLDADMQDDPETLGRVAAPVGCYDMACVYRSREEMPPLRRLANFLAVAPYWFFTGVRLHDVQAGYRVYARPVARYLAENLPVAGGYTLEHTSMALFGRLAQRRQRPFRIAEVPNPCPYGQSESHITIHDNVALTKASVLNAYRLGRALRS